MNVLSDTEGLRGFQATFAARIRDPRGQPCPQGVPVDRMRIYETLLFNNLEGFLSACFPITRELLGMRAWHLAARRFFMVNRCQSPLFRDISGEFLAWMETEAVALFPDCPYLYEFMHYEWLELHVSIDSEEVDLMSVDSVSDLIYGIPVLNPTAKLACYRYPVHRIGPGFDAVKTDDRVYCYLVYRDELDRVRFIELNPISARLLELLSTGRMTGYAAMQQVAAESNQQYSEPVIEMGRTLLDDLRQSGAVLGTRRAP